ncbi:LysR substrate-binding domain-containing protein [Psychromonas ossibalaenae]|uniref:LysR substrate-binding domain-containing protein n=1 Tax=Psychromonas ossibalaenae TaxID=444922 RepID=UPI001B7FA312|nr:LysR substrate-binding domain-containing protein [Psychromonas ossibalaenae]
MTNDEACHYTLQIVKPYDNHNVMKLPPLIALTYFNASASHMSFKAAANQLCVTEGAVSRQIKRLEEYYGCSLFERLGRGVKLTNKGKRLFTVSSLAMQQIAEVSDEIRGMSPQLDILVTTSFAIRWLMPRLSIFESCFPEYPINIHTGKSNNEPLGSQLDAKIVYVLGNPYDEDSSPPNNSQFIMAEWLQPVCSPSILPKGQPININDLSEYRLIFNEPTGRDWRLWLKSVPDFKLNFENSLRFEHDDTAIQASVTGLGISLTNKAYIEHELKTGILVPAIAELEPIAIGAHYIITDPLRRTTPNIDAFVNWLLDTAKNSS